MDLSRTLTRVNWLKMAMRNRRRCSRGLEALVACLLTMTVNVAWAQDLASPVLLVAAPEVRGLYGRTVAIALPVGNAQHVGFMINRVSKLTLASVFPKHAPSKKVIDPVYIGGPDAMGAIFAFVRAPSSPPADTIRLFEDLFLAVSPHAINRIIEQTPNEARFVTGYISWLADELEAEIESGYWRVSEPHAELLFRKDVGLLWTELIERLPPEDVAPSRHVSIRRAISATGTEGALRGRADCCGTVVRMKTHAYR